MKHIQLLFIILAGLPGCSSPEADLEEADRLIAAGQYNQALTLLEEEMKLEYADTTQYDRIQHRMFLSRKGLLFRRVKTLMASAAWKEAEKEMTNIDSIIQAMPEDRSRLYRFDFFYSKSRIDSVLQGKEAWAKALLHSTQFPLADPERLMDIFAELAFYQAGNEAYAKALDMMDRMMRNIKIAALDERLKAIVYLYMEGMFDQALTELEQIEDNKKDRHWERLQRFLEQYASHLNTEERFKLW